MFPTKHYGILKNTLKELGHYACKRYIMANLAGNVKITTLYPSPHTTPWA